MTADQLKPGMTFVDPGNPAKRITVKTIGLCQSSRRGVWRMHVNDSMCLHTLSQLVVTSAP